MGKRYKLLAGEVEGITVDCTLWENPRGAWLSSMSKAPNALVRFGIHDETIFAGNAREVTHHYICLLQKNRGLGEAQSITANGVLVFNEEEQFWWLCFLQIVLSIQGVSWFLGNWPCPRGDRDVVVPYLWALSQHKGFQRMLNSGGIYARRGDGLDDEGYYPIIKPTKIVINEGR